MISGFLINNHFRYKLKLGSYGRMSSYLAVVAAPAIMSSLLHVTVRSSENSEESFTNAVINF